MVSVGRRLVATRHALGLDQKDIREAINVGQGTLSNWERGERLADVPAMIRLCDRYGVTLDWIYRSDLSGLRHELAAKVEAAHARLMSDCPTDFRATG